MIDTTKTIREVRYNGTAIPLLGGVDNPIVVTSDAEMETYLNDDKYLGMYVKFNGESENYLNGQVYKIAQEGEVSKFYQLPTLDNEGTAADLAAGKQLINSGGKVITGTGTIATEIGTGDFWVKIIDYDGTVLLEKRGNNGDSFDLPTAPSHEGLVFQEWSASCPITDGKVVIDNNNIMAGAVYTTASGQNEFDITLTKVTGLSVTLKMDGTKDWGDGTSDTATSHTYTAYGDYTIKCNGTTMTTSDSSGLFGQSNVSNYYCTFARIATKINIGNYAFYNCRSLKNVTISNDALKIGEYAFSACRVLMTIVVPTSATSIGIGAFASCSSLTQIIISNNVTKINTSTFAACSCLTSVILPSSVTSIGNYAFSSCYSLKNVIIPNSVTNIYSQVFIDCAVLTNIVISNNVTKMNTAMFVRCYALMRCDFSQHTAVPMLANTDAFSGINAICKIIVPDSLYDEWIAATNWSRYANYIYKASEVNNE